MDKDKLIEWLYSEKHSRPNSRLLAWFIRKLIAAIERGEFEPDPCCICEGKVLGEIHYQTHECGDDWNRIAPFCPNCGRPLRKDME